MRIHHVVIRMNVETHHLLAYVWALSGSWNKEVVALLYASKTKVSDVLFQDRKLYLSISWGLFMLYPPSGWGFDKPEVQIPTQPPICPARGVVGLDIDRCISFSLHTSAKTRMTCSQIIATTETSLLFEVTLLVDSEDMHNISIVFTLRT